MLFDMFLICPYYLDMSESDSSSNFSINSKYESECELLEDLYENLVFYLICLEPALVKSNKKVSGIKNRNIPLNFIYTWTDVMF